ncbi:MAG TPA: ABC transporter permease subunit [Syntrophales bacterium]|jgi:NitT/TauT family transport system permease protein|nr:ABC transporter permease subunit [Syntrophales bacterium]
MQQTNREFGPLAMLRPVSWGDGVVLLGIGVLLYAGVRLAMGAPEWIKGPEIHLTPEVLPYYLARSLGRMLAAYALSILFSLIYGSLAARHRTAEKILLPLLDVMQSVPILSFLPVVLLGLSAVLPRGLALELSAIVLIFTSQAWNLTFAWYQSLTTIPADLKEASSIFRFSPRMRFRKLELPFAAISLIWNSMMSWAGGWFFLMASEIFMTGNQDFRLPGLGSYLQAAANAGDLQALAWGLAALVGTIVLLDQIVWCPLLVWSRRFKLGTAEEDIPPASWFYKALRSSYLLTDIRRRLSGPFARFSDLRKPRRKAGRIMTFRRFFERGGRFIFYGIGLAGLSAILYETYQAAQLLSGVPWSDWGRIGFGVLATSLRVLVSLIIALAWTVPLGVAIGTNRRLAAWLQPVIQITASIPATALFPIILLFVLKLPGGLEMAAVLLMLLGSQWYLLFNVIAGASAIPQDLKHTATLLQLSRRLRWRTLILPSLFPYIITGAITAGGGAWNASIVAEYVRFGGETFFTVGVGSLIAQATAAGDYPLLLASTLAMILAVTVANRLVWRRFYRTAEEKYRMD